ncbi:CaiB/BaiF CoA transferase family protein [Mesorhizobium sangaii]|uniref:Crotonobetainyl-CoA:carnitine CoA-transferase CaiB-like acyl-CoA transferase n=1 Tax=Mesorhizobium sangaii TaxID=505389 RepID=A0A841PEJ8_9HYPH|nr:CoA transferase [Mesorhizobium sangaii]MBB6413744.1 crotonobetainyl-CoA:carnitine CoA-transferase CaiB-like acyl-CoA transferase [Mesorhizobium sangaii]
MLNNSDATTNLETDSDVHPLSGIQVLAFTHYAAGPIAAQYLGSLGAKVIKIEAPTGDFQRGGIKEPTAPDDAPSPYFLGMNRNQRSLSINLKKPGARSVIRKLVSQADVILENFRPGVLERMGLGNKEIISEHPAMVYCSIAAYDPAGPSKDKPGQDLIIQALSGIASLGGPAGGPPIPAGAYVVDTYTASQAVIGIQAALRQRDQTGRGQWVRVDMMSCALHLLASESTYFLNAQTPPTRARNGISHVCHGAPYGIYATVDGAVALVAHAASLPDVAAALGLSDQIVPLLEGKGALTNRDQIAERLSNRIRQLTTDEVFSNLSPTGILLAPVRSVGEALADPSVRDLIREVNHTYGGRYRVAVEPLKFTDSPLIFDRPAPALGEHSIEVLRDAGVGADDIKDLISNGAVRVAAVSLGRES